MRDGEVRSITCCVFIQYKELKISNACSCDVYRDRIECVQSVAGEITGGTVLRIWISKMLSVLMIRMKLHKKIGFVKAFVQSGISCI